jgi:hypothetical protein
MTLLRFPLAALVLLLSAPLPPVVSRTTLAPGIDCDGAYNFITGLTCQSPCSEGCTFGPLQGEAGWGRACFCDVVGPPADCCRLVVIPNPPQGSILSKAGDCSASGCDQGLPGCLLIVMIDPESGATIGAFTKCPSAP